MIYYRNILILRNVLYIGLFRRYMTELPDARMPGETIRLHGRLTWIKRQIDWYLSPAYLEE